MKPITERRWTLLSPWKLAVSPLDDPAMPDVLEFEHSEDATRAVEEHNRDLEHGPESCSDCGAPFNDADGPVTRLCPACAA